MIPVRPLYVWGGYVVLAILLAIVAGGSGWVKFVMALYLVWALVETVRFIRHKREGKVIAPEQAEETFDEVSELQEEYRGWNEDREVAESQREFETLWMGAKEISFTYRDRGRGNPQEVTAVVTKVISPEFGEDSDTYFQGVPAGGVERYFCLGYLSKGRKVTDVATGETGTLRKVLGVKRRVYK